MPIILKDIDKLTNNNTSISSIDFRRPTLNDVFLKFTGRYIEDRQDKDSAEGGFMEKMYSMRKSSKKGFNFDLELDKLYAIWLREFKVFLREKSRLLASTFTPLLWLFVLGGGLGSTLSTPFHTSNVDYQKFIFPGIVIMSVIFSSVFFGSYIIWDRKFDFLKSVMVAPVRRSTIFLGKTFGGMTTSLIQAFILLAIGIIIGINYTPYLSYHSL